MIIKYNLVFLLDFSLVLKYIWKIKDISIIKIYSTLHFNIIVMIRLLLFVIIQ